MARYFSGFLLGCLVLALTITGVQAAGKHARWAGGSLQILGFDTTSYFKLKRPVIGDASHTVKWKTGTWHFKNAKQATLFKSNPSAYTPRFGAYCTGGLSQRHVINGNPMIWRMYKGKVYMFYAQAGARRFDKDPEGVIAAARAYAKTVGIIEN